MKVLTYLSVAAFIFQLGGCQARVGSDTLNDGCSTSESILTVKELSASPDPPTQGGKYTIDLKGTLSSALEEGAVGTLTIKLGLVTVMRSTMDICAEIQTSGLKCPLPAGNVEYKTEVDLAALNGFSQRCAWSNA
ncbi:hypothetical protein DM01DRAFT_1379976 [Hesseltinella vesiculosa]|uniref:Phosphatidylglycerol/phosphatidylinositol transfer protein n=1 Tax=Hesseltinella vesiculosa TaxID=101127 RepID=A0A1X2GVT6_9FUNG|nr:hypothetical protein DM01DRAFT_1379976 [Hesseltinella vesiculosa]